MNQGDGGGVDRDVQSTLRVKSMYAEGLWEDEGKGSVEENKN